MKYLLIDTNIYIQCALLELEGDDHDILKKLHTLLEQNKLTLLLPEVVELEFDKILQEKFEKIENQIGKYKEAINKDNTLDSKVKLDLTAKLTESTDERAKNKVEVAKTVAKLFQHKNTIKLKLSSLVMENAYRRFLANKKPYNREEEGQIQPDSLIIEGAKEYLQSKTDYEFLFCSSNKRDFVDNPKDKDNKFVISKAINSDFSNINYYITLFQCLNDNFQTKYPKEVIEKASSEYYQPINHSPLTPSAFTVNPQHLTLTTPINMGAASPNLINQNNAYMVSPLNMGAVQPTITGHLNQVTVTATEERICQKCGKSFKAVGFESHLNIPYCNECRNSITTY